MRPCQATRSNNSGRHATQVIVGLRAVTQIECHVVSALARAVVFDGQGQVNDRQLAAYVEGTLVTVEATAVNCGRSEVGVAVLLAAELLLLVLQHE